MESKDKIREVFESMNISEEQLTTIQEDIVNNNDAKLSYKRFDRPKRIKYNLAVTASCIMLMTILISVTIYATSGKNVLDYFFNGEGEDIYYEINKGNPIQTVEYEGYTISLVSCIYDDTTRFGYTVFSITREDGNTKLLKQIGNSAFGERELYFAKEGSGGISFDMEKEGNTLYYYFSFIETTKNEVYLMDASTPNQNPVRTFTLSNDDSNYKIAYGKCGDFVCSISPLGIKIDGKGSLNIDTDREKMTIKYSNGKSKKFIITGITSSNRPNHESVVYSSKFERLLNVDEMVTLKVGDMEFELEIR